MARKLYATCDPDGTCTIWRGRKGLRQELCLRSSFRFDTTEWYWNVTLQEGNAMSFIEIMTPADFRRIFGTALAPGSGPVEVVLRGEVVGK